MEARKKEEKRLRLDLVHGFGSICSQGLRNSVGLIDEDGQRKVIYPMSKFIAVKVIDRPDMSFIKIHESVEKIDCIAISPNKKFVAIAEKISNSVDEDHHRCLNIGIYSIRTSFQQQASNKGGQQERRTFQYSQIEKETSQFVSLQFSSDSRFLACITGPPEYKLLFLDTSSKIKDLASSAIVLPVNKINIQPRDNHIISLSGPNVFKIVRMQEGSFVYVNESIRKLNPYQNFTDHCWYDETKIALANDKCEIFIIQDGEVRYILNNQQEQSKSIINQISYNNDQLQNQAKLFSVNCLCPFKKGLITASDNGLFGIYLKNEDSLNNQQQFEEENKLVFLRGWSADRNRAIVAMDINETEEVLAVAFKNNDIATFDLLKVLPSVPEPVEQIKRNTKFIERKVKFDFIYNGFHSGPVNSLDVCIQRPLIVTASQQDSSIRIWNYRNFKCELARKFKLEPKIDKNDKSDKNEQSLQCVAIHPSGYYLAASIYVKVQIFHILNTDLKLYREIQSKQQQCNCIRFSNGGQMLACSYQKSKTSYYNIIVYNSYTLEVIATLKNHTQQLTDIIFGPRDEFIASCGFDGAVYRFTTDKWERKDFIIPSGQQQLKFNSLMYNPQPLQEVMIATIQGDINNDNQGMILEIKDGENFKEDQYIKHETKSYKLTTLQHVVGLHKYQGLIGGTCTGDLKVFSNQFTAQSVYQTIPTHIGKVLRVKSSPEGRYVFSTGEDGQIFIFQVAEINEDGHVLSLKTEVKEDGENDINAKAQVVEKALADIVLVQRSEIDIYLGEQKKLKNDYEDLENKMEYQSQEEKKRMEKQIEEMKEKMKLEIQTWSRRYEELKSQKTQIEKESANLLKNMENNHMRAVEELENLYEKKLQFENEKYLQQEQELLEERMKFEKKLKEVERRHDTNISQLKGDFNDNFNKAQKVYETTKATANELRKIYEEKLTQQEEEHEIEIRDLNDRHKKETDDLLNQNAKYQMDAELYKRNNKMATEAQQRMEKAEQEKIAEIQRLESRLSDANNQIEGLKNDIKQMEEQMKKKEKKIHEYKQKINDLQKSKHVLSFRTTEMRKSLEPKEAQIEKLKEELFKLESEFEGMIKTSQTQSDKMKKMQNQIDTLQTSLKKQCELTQQKENLLNKIIMDIHDCVKEKDTKEWNTELQKMYQNYVCKDEQKQIPHDLKGVDEMGRQIQHLEKSIYQMNKSSEKIIIRREKEIYKKTKENAELIYDLNDMRKLNKEFFTELSNKRIQIENLKKENKNLIDELNKIKGTGPGNTYGFSSTQNARRVMENDDIQNYQAEARRLDSLDRPQTTAQQPQQQHQQMSSSHVRPQSMRITKRGNICKGPNFDTKQLSNFDKVKMMDMMSEMEQRTNQLIQQEATIKIIRDKIKRHMSERGCQDQQLEEEIMMLQDSGDMQDELNISRPLSSKEDRFGNLHPIKK